MFSVATGPSDSGTAVSSIDTGHYHTCAIKTDDTVQCWGDIMLGQATVPSNLGTVSSIDTGHYHTCAIKTDDTVQCWGWNINGQVSVIGSWDNKQHRCWL